MASNEPNDVSPPKNEVDQKSSAPPSQMVEVVSASDAAGVSNSAAPTDSADSDKKSGNEAADGPKVNADGSPSFKAMSVEEALDYLKTTKEGLSDEESRHRLEEYGPNMLPEKVVNPILAFLKFMWNPLSWAMEAAAILAIGLLDYADFVLILFLLLLNSIIGFFEERSAGNAVAALKAQLAPQSKCLRNGEFKCIAAQELVPGDVIRFRIGDVVPADVKVISEESIKIDQSSLTGESLPVTKYHGRECYAGSICKQGEAVAVVIGTGLNTFFGRAASLISETESEGHLQVVLKQVGNVCLITIAVWVIIELGVQFGLRGTSSWANSQPPLGLFGNLYGQSLCQGGANNCPTLNNILVIIVGGIPVAMPTVLSVTMAIGATRLSKKQAIVSRLTAVEELAGMDVLCSDKTGTLTLNHLSINQAELFPLGGADPFQILMDASLAAKVEDQEPIDVCVVEALGDRKAELENFELVHFTPFDPVSKRTIGKIRDKKTGTIFRTCKGAPQVVLKMAHNKDEISTAVQAKIEEFGVRGYRALGVARSDDGDVPVEQCKWTMVGLIPLFDPPRHDTGETIRNAIAMGIVVKMITGDQLAIAKETARQLGMNTDIYPTAMLIEGEKDSSKAESINELIERSDGFAEVFPEHKYEIVKRLQDMKHVVGMTGDGVNDAPALKKADIGIAVAGATDAARAAADIVLMAPGLSVIIDAIVGSRKIFQRMKNYAQYSIAMTVRITFTFGLLTTIYNWYFPPILVVVLAVLNDGTIMTISKDRVTPSPRPDAWRLKTLFMMSFVYGLYLTLSTIIVYIVASADNSWFNQIGAISLARSTYEGASRLRTFIYLQVSISGQALIFVTRTRRISFLDRPAWIVLGAFVIAQLVATLIAVYGFMGYPGYSIDTYADAPDEFSVLWGRDSALGCGWGNALIAWIWCIVWYLPLDVIKLTAEFISNRRFQHQFRRMSSLTATDRPQPKPKTAEMA